MLVTGAAKRLGREIALKLAANGWRVAVHYRGSQTDAQATAAECAALTPGAATFQADLGDEAAVRDVLSACRLGPPLARVDELVESFSEAPDEPGFRRLPTA